MEEVLGVGIDWGFWCWKFKDFRLLGSTGGWTERDWRSLPLRERCRNATERGAPVVNRAGAGEAILQNYDPARQVRWSQKRTNCFLRVLDKQT